MTAPDMTRSTAQNAQLALMLEVSGTPKPGNVDREREYDDLKFEQFLAGAVGAFDGLSLAADGEPVGRAFERAVAGMSQQQGGNTQFGALLLTTPLVAAAGEGALTRDNAEAVVTDTTVEDAVNFYRAFEHVDVAVNDPPEGMEALDVRRGSDAAPAIRERGLTLGELMEESAVNDGIAAEWSDGFSRTFEAATGLQESDGAVSNRASALFLALLASEVDTFVVTQHDTETALEVRDRAQDVLAGDENPYELAQELVEREINPGTTADIVAGALFIALERGLSV
ncbi:triphosphoribosyl-dephospho-CoA synthase [Halovenus rubra]|uniref:Triphosphoribosyl-dephospho-CoA synthase n=2 Tax=Halovenus rubra TaxID=869890 RepID=A0ACC7E1P0_9EURY|nr:triphosphoribosyl-dephospho-CoA synthase [Halovenus rubra]